MTESDYYNRKIARQLDAQQRLEREALKAGPTIGDYLMLAAAGIIGIAGGDVDVIVPMQHCTLHSSTSG